MSMPTGQYNPQRITQDFDEFARREWERLVATPLGEISLHIHTHYLRQHVPPGSRVLEIGAGAGRFTQILAGLGARIVVADISPVQLDLNRQHAAQYGFAQAVEDWQLADICDLKAFDTASFDQVVAYGGPLSYVLERRQAALDECLRVLRPGGVLLLSVMSVWGTIHRFFEEVVNLPPAVNQRILATGDLTAETFPGRQGNFMHMFRAGELRQWLEASELELLAMSASSVLSIQWDGALSVIRQDAERWQELLRIELEASAEPASWNMGTHIIAVGRLPLLPA